MKLKLIPHTKNNYESSGLLIKCNSLSECISILDKLNVLINDDILYPIPNITPNSLYGFFIKNSHLDIHGKGVYLEPFQKVSESLFIPHFTNIFPFDYPSEMAVIFRHKIYIFHHEIGFVELGKPVNIETKFHFNFSDNFSVKKPSEGIKIHTEIKNFIIHYKSPEQVLDNLEKNMFPEFEKRKDDSLNILEWSRLKLYQGLNKIDDLVKGGKLRSFLDKKLMAKVKNDKSFLSKIAIKVDNYAKRIQIDYVKLEQRNKKEMEKLIDMLNKDPKNMLKHALPLDNGAGRGNDLSGSIFASLGSLLLSGFGSNSLGGGASVLLSGDDYFTLRQQYIKMANDFVAKGNYQDAAYIYIKLLKDYRSAAQILKDGKMYQEAASIYLKYLNDKQSAAECYVLGKMYKEAIVLYLELGNFEKVAELYLQTNQYEKAEFYYNKVISELLIRNQYLKAALIYKDKLNNLQKCQALLWEGTIKNIDTFNCLNNYLNNIVSEEEVNQKIDIIFKNHLSSSNAIPFLQALSFELKRFPNSKQLLKSITQEVISMYGQNNKNLINFIQDYYDQKSEIRKDITLFKLKK
jgi:tetratricopeptide (TPR) repeat protein